MYLLMNSNSTSPFFFPLLLLLLLTKNSIYTFISEVFIFKIKLKEVECIIKSSTFFYIDISLRKKIQWKTY